MTPSMHTVKTACSNLMKTVYLYTYFFISSVMLSWFMEDDTADSAVCQEARVVTTSDINRRATTTAALDPNICINSVRQYCNSAAWSALQVAFAEATNNPVWYCAACCNTIDENDRCVACDSCLQWLHFWCTG